MMSSEQCSSLSYSTDYDICNIFNIAMLNAQIAHHHCRYHYRYPFITVCLTFGNKNFITFTIIFHKIRTRWNSDIVRLFYTSASTLWHWDLRQYMSHLSQWTWETDYYNSYNTSKQVTDYSCHWVIQVLRHIACFSIAFESCRHFKYHRNKMTTCANIRNIFSNAHMDCAWNKRA